MNYIIEYPTSVAMYLFILVMSVLFAIAANSSKSRKVKSFFILLVILCLTIPAGLRDISVGLDTGNYFVTIQSLGSSYTGELFYNYFEAGFVSLLRVLVFFVKEPHYVILLISLITNTLIIKTLWDFKDKYNYSFSFSVFLYYVLYYFETYNIIRQWLAIAIIFFSIRYLVNKKYLIFIIFSLIAVSIHTSAFIVFVFLPIHMMTEKKLFFRHKVFFGISALVFVILYKYILDAIGVTSAIEKYYSYYVHGGENLNTDIGFFFLVRLAIIIFSVFVLIKRGFSDYKSAKFIVLINLLGTVLSMGGYFYRFAGRLGTYAMVFEIILWSMLIKQKNKVLGKLTKYVFILISLYLLYVNLSVSAQGQMPYKFFFVQ